MAQRIPRWVWVFAGVKIAFHLATVGYERHREEFYLIAMSKRLAFSSVDYQPIAPALVRIERAAFGDSLVGLRLAPALAGATTILLAALIARELGGDTRAQTTAAFALLVVPGFVAMNSTMNAISIETAAFMLVAFIFARLLRTGEKRLYLALGAGSGFALLVGWTMLAFLLGIVAATLLSPLRVHLRDAWLWTAPMIAGALLLPSVLWQLHHGFPVVDLVLHRSPLIGSTLGFRGRGGFLLSLLLLPGPLSLLLVVPSVRKFVTDENARPFGLILLTALILFLLPASGKGYYALPGIAVLCCVAAIQISEWSTRARRIAALALVVNLLPVLILVYPSASRWVLHNESVARATQLSERIGWRDFAQEISKVTTSLPTSEQHRAILLANDFTLSSVIDFYRDKYAVPRISVSGNMSAYLWWPRFPDDHVAIAVGFSQHLLKRFYNDVTVVAHITNSEGVHGYSWGESISICKGPRMSESVMRALLRNFRT